MLLQRSQCHEKWPRLMPASKGEWVQSMRFPCGVTTPAVSLFKMLCSSLKQQFPSHQEEKERLKDTKLLLAKIWAHNSCICTWGVSLCWSLPPLFHRCFADWLCVWLCMFVFFCPPPCLDCLLMNNILLHNFTFIHLSVCLLSHLFICTDGGRGSGGMSRIDKELCGILDRN